MHPDLSSHLHTEECNKLVLALRQCHAQNFFGKYIGACNAIESQMLRCLKNERLERRRKNMINASVKREKLKNEYDNL